MRLTKQRSQLQTVENQYELLQDQLELVTEAEKLQDDALTTHPLNTVSNRYSIYKKYKDDFETINRMLMDKIREYEQLLNDYKQHSSDIGNPKLQEYIREIDESIAIKYDNEFEIVKELLANSNQVASYTKGIQVRNDLDNALFQQGILVHGCLTALLQYNRISQFLPGDYSKYYCPPKHLEWLRFVTEQKSVEACREIAVRYRSNATEMETNIQHQLVFGYSCQQNTLVGELQTKLGINIDCLNLKLHEYESMGTSVDAVYKEAKISINRFISKDFPAKKALECVSLTALCDVNKRFLMLEVAANNAGDNLINFMTDEKWFLDELYLYSCLEVELLGLISNDGGKNGHLNLSVKVVKEVNQMYFASKEMYGHFTTDLLFETIRCVISGDESVLKIIQALSEFCMDAVPLMDTLNAILEGKMTMNENSCSSLMMDLREKYVSLCEEDTVGGKLLKKIDEAFEILNQKHKNILKAFEKIEQKLYLMKIDHINDSYKLVQIMLSQLPVLNEIFLIKKFEALLQFFTESLQTACAFKGTGPGNPMNSEVHCRPIKNYIAAFIWRLVLGMGPLAVAQTLCIVIEGTGLNLASETHNELGQIGLEEQCKKAVNHCLNQDTFTPNTLNQASNLCITLDGTWKKRERVIQLQEIIKKQQDELGTLQFLITSHYWLHEHILVTQPNLFTLCPVSRGGLLMQINVSLDSMKRWQQTIDHQKVELQTVTSAVMQRLKWAVGANPGLEELLNEFNKRSSNHRNKSDKECLMGAVCMKYAQSVWNFEIQRSHTPDGLEKDKEFLQIISNYEQACIILQQYSTLVTPIEEAIVELLDPEGVIDQAWLSNVKALLQNIGGQLKTDVAEEEKKVVSAQDKLQMCAHTLRTLMGNHHRMASDVRGLLKQAMRLNDSHQKIIREYLTRYKEFIDTISELYTNVLSKDFTEKMVEVSLKQIKDLNQIVEPVYDDLFTFQLENFESTSQEIGREQSPIPITFDGQQKGE